MINRREIDHLSLGALGRRLFNQSFFPARESFTDDGIIRITRLTEESRLNLRNRRNQSHELADRFHGVRGQISSVDAICARLFSDYRLQDDYQTFLSALDTATLRVELISRQVLENA